MVFHTIRTFVGIVVAMLLTLDTYGGLFGTHLIPSRPRPNYVFAASLKHLEIISWSSQHAMRPYEVTGTSFTSVGYTNAYFTTLTQSAHFLITTDRSSLVYRSFCFQHPQTNLYKRIQSSGLVLLVVQEYYDTHDRTTDLILTKARLLSGTKFSILGRDRHLTHFLLVVSPLCRHDCLGMLWDRIINRYDFHIRQYSITTTCPSIISVHLAILSIPPYPYNFPHYCFFY